MSIHVCKCTHNGRDEYHLRYPGMTEEEAQNIADMINGGALDIYYRIKKEQEDKLLPNDMETKQVTLEPTEAMIDEGAKRLVRWEDGCVWPDSWGALDVAVARNEAERVWRSMWMAANA